MTEVEFAWTKLFDTFSQQLHLTRVSTKMNPDYSFAVKRRGTNTKPWRWEIYRAGQTYPVRRSTIFFESMSVAAKEGKKALADLLAERAA